MRKQIEQTKEFVGFYAHLWGAERLAFFDRALVKAERELGRQASNPQLLPMLMESYLGERFAASEAEESGLA
jgi:hypothetical protein